MQNKTDRQIDEQTVVKIGYGQVKDIIYIVLDRGRQREIKKERKRDRTCETK